jgi:hypothetical protein
MNTLLGILGIGLAWTFYGVALIGLGALFLGIIYRRHLISVACCFWVGLTLLITGLQIINLFHRIDLLVVRSIWLFGFVCFWQFRVYLDVSFWSRLKLWQKIFVGLALLWLADRALASPYVYDSALYHFSSVRWANEEPLPPGLGNLHGRLAFNQSYFLYVSFLNLLPKRGDGHNFANSLLLVCTLLTLLEKGSESSLNNIRRFIFLWLSGLLIFLELLEPGISSPSPEPAMFCLQLVMFSLVITAWTRSSEQTREERAIEVSTVLLLSGLAITFKLSSIVFSLGIAGVLAKLFVSKFDKEFRWRVLWPLSVALLLGVTWVVRNVIASGYLIYPLESAACPVSFRVPSEQVREEARWIFSWARAPGIPWSKVLADWSWLQPWANGVGRRPEFIFALAVFGFAASCLIVLFCKSGKAIKTGLVRGGDFLALSAVTISALCFWFLMAPDPRFAGAVPLLATTCLLGIVLEGVQESSGFSLVRAMAMTVFGFGICLAVFSNGFGLVRLKKRQIGSRVPVPELTQKVTDSGLRVWVPIYGDRTGDAPLPATPYFRRELRLRGPNLASGFCLETKSAPARPGGKSEN